MTVISDRSAGQLLQFLRNFTFVLVRHLLAVTSRLDIGLVLIQNSLKLFDVWSNWLIFCQMAISFLVCKELISPGSWAIYQNLLVYDGEIVI